MDFIDYQTFSVIDTSNDEGGSDLPQPSSTLKISTFQEESHSNDDGFKLPPFFNDHLDLQNNGKTNLYDRMSQYAKLSIASLNINDSKSYHQEEPLNKTSRFSEPTKATLSASDVSYLLNDHKSPAQDVTDVVLSKKLSSVLADYVLTNYQSRTQLRNSLRLLEENEDKLPYEKEKLIQAGYIGTLARKTLRSDIENELLKEHLTILEEFRPIVRRIKRLSTSVQAVRCIGEDILQSEGTPAGTDPSAFEQIDKLHSELDTLYLKKKILSSLKDYFTLTQVEDDLIMNGHIDFNYFRVIDKLMTLKEHATFLLSLPESKAGASLVSKLNTELNFVNRKIFNYLVDFLYSYEANVSSSSAKAVIPNENSLGTFQKAMIYLSNDLEYFNEFLKKVTAIRSKIVLDEFLSLFDFNPKDSRPITFSAHDPLRYIGDVLANVHASIANEADFVKSLFKFQETQSSSATILLENRDFLDGLDIKLLNEIVQSLSNSCRIRIEQIVRFEEDPVTNLEILRLLDLYQMMFVRKGIEKESAIVSNLRLLGDVTKEKIRQYFTEMIGNLPAIDEKTKSSSIPPEWLSDYMNKLAELFEAFDKGRVSESDDVRPLIDDAFLKKVVEEPIQTKLIKMIQGQFPLAKKNDEARSSLLTMQINCLDMVKCRLLPFTTTIFSQNEEASNIFKQIEEKLRDTVDHMLQLQNKLLLENTGLDLYYNLFNMIFPISSIEDELDYDMYLPLADNPLMNLDTVRNKVNRKLNDYLPQALTDFQENLLFRLTSPVIADEISTSCFKTLSQFYIYFRRILVHLYPERKQDIMQILNFSEEEFKTLVGIENIL